MPPKLPVVSSRAVIRALQRAGFEEVRQHGSHVILLREGQPVVVPVHRTIRKGTLRNILRQANLTVEEFVRLLGE